MSSSESEINEVDNGSGSSSEDTSESEAETSQEKRTTTKNLEIDSTEESDEEERTEIRSDLKSMSFEKLMKLKEELGAKVYNEAIFGTAMAKPKAKKAPTDFKRLNKNRPRERSAKHTVPFLGREKTKAADKTGPRDPRFDENAGEYNPTIFKENYSFLNELREKEIGELRTKLIEAKDDDERQNIKFLIQRLENKNREDERWKAKQQLLKEEKEEFIKARKEGRTPHYVTKKERRAKELVQQFVELKKTGKLGKHLEKRRKKNTAKDRKKFSFD